MRRMTANMLAFRAEPENPVRIVAAEAHKTAPKKIILDLDATDDPLHGHQEGPRITSVLAENSVWE